jgi:hypothetical protein
MGERHRESELGCDPSKVFEPRQCHDAAAAALRRYPQQMFDVTFYDREPLLDVKLDQRWAMRLTILLMSDAEVEQIQAFCRCVVLSDGTTVPFAAIWTINYMPEDLDTRNVNLVGGEEVVGFGGETVREIIRTTYRCRTRAEEDFFLARWIAS